MPMERTHSELRPTAELSFALPANPDHAALILQQYLSFSCSGLIDVMRVMENFDGWFTAKAGAALYTSALMAPVGGDFVEIGSFKGRSTSVLGYAIQATQRANKIYAVDPHNGSEEHQEGGSFADRMPVEGTTYHEFIRNMQRCGHADRVVPMRMTSIDAAAAWSKHAKPISLLFIDGDHSVNGCEADFLAWDRFLVPRGILLLHDVGPDFPGPKHVVDSHIHKSDRYQSLFQVDSLHVAIKRKI